MFRCKELLDDRTQLSAQVVAIEPPLKEGLRGRASVFLDKISESVRFAFKTFSLDHQSHCIGISLRGVRNPSGQKKNLNMTRERVNKGMGLTLRSRIFMLANMEGKCCMNRVADVSRIF